ncbi:MAG TPA: OmpA family protein [Vicinamibacterales bacterium]|nr:OmpA family protein [Vicinamibacterales bacterium]
MASQVSAQNAPAGEEVRPAITSFWGDTGLWFVPTAEVLKPGGWAFGAYRTELDFKQGSTDVAYYPGTLAVGAGPRTEIFGAVRAVTSIDRDTRPLFAPANTPIGGVVNEYPFVREGWTGNNFGDVYVGAKINLLSEHRRQPMALALRGTVKLPTAGEDNVGTGQFDYFADTILSKVINRSVELAGFGGFAFRGDPGGLSLSDGFRWGFGAAFGARSSLRFTTELHGEVPFNDTVLVAPGTVVGNDGSVSPVTTQLDSRVNAAAGVTWQHPSGMLLGVGMNYRLGLDGESAVGLQLRLGFHSGVRIFQPPPPVPPAPRRVEAPAPAPVAPVPEPEKPVSRPLPPTPPVNRAPTVRAQCDPCRVEVGQTLTLRSTSQDPDGDNVRSSWTIPSGTITDARLPTTQWRAQTSPGKVVLTVTAEDGRGGKATDSVTVEVIALRVLADVQFALDSSTLRPDALRTLTVALKELNDSPSINLHIEGYASPEGSAEYNKALSERRARAVRDYLTSRGIPASRLTITAYGEERLKYDDSQEATRALNRRAALIID